MKTSTILTFLLLQVAICSAICHSLESHSSESDESSEEYHNHNDHPNVRICSLPAEVGPCRGSVIRFFFNKLTRRCERFFYGGCKGNKNNFQTIEECEQTCKRVCRLPKEFGKCKGAFPRYFYNTSTRKCEPFSYGGCDGNGNNFLTQESCEQRCRPMNICTLPKKVGPCKGSFPRYFFNTKKVRCELFYYGGCDGNGNNFLTRDDCRRHCY